jgi:hypothetical protein
MNIFLLVEERITRLGISKHFKKAFFNLDLALLEEANHNYYAEQYSKYYIEEVDYNDSSGFWFDNEAGEILVSDEYDNKYYFDLKTELREDNYDNKYLAVDELKFKNKFLDKIKFSEEFKRSVKHEADNIIEQLEKDL